MTCFALRFEHGATAELPVARTRGCQPDAFLWIHLDAETEEGRTWLSGQADVPEAVQRALLARETRPRIEGFGNGTLVNLRGLAEDEDDEADALVSIRLWAERGRVITASYRALRALPLVRKRMEAGRLRDPGDLIAFLASAITDALDPEVATLGDTLDTCEDDLDVRQSFAQRRVIASARARAIEYRRFVVPQRQALERLTALEEDWLEPDDRVHLREAADRVARMAEELEAVRERAALLHEQLTDLRAEQIDGRSLTLSVVALIFLPLTFLTGLLGMNVEGIPYAHEPWAFAAVVGICAAIAVGVAGYFTLAHWFRS
jgi:zinc transporter